MPADRDPASAELVDFYTRRIAEHGVSYQAMWGDAAAWKSSVRFMPLASLPIAEGDTVVDIGCGAADLALFAREHLPAVRYVGVEMVPGFAAAARDRGVEVVEIDAFRDPDALPPADWYVTVGTLNKEWCLAGLPGDGCEARILDYLERLYRRARKGVAATLTTDVVDYRKPGVCNMNPGAVLDRMRGWTPHFAIWHGYPLYEFFAAAWRGVR